MADRAIRYVDSVDPIRFRIELATPTDLAAVAKKFYLWGTDAASTRHVDGEDATAVDISSAEGATPQTIWILEWAPGAEGYRVTGWHRAEFEIDYGGGNVRQYPRPPGTLEVLVMSHRGVVAQP